MITHRRSLSPLVGASVIIAFAACPVVALASDAWWNAAWPYRREITLESFQPSGLPGEDIAVVTMPTAGKTLKDASDIRVVTPGGRLRRHRVLMTGPGDVVQVAFAVQANLRRYFVYYGNPSPGSSEPLEIRRGLLMEAWPRPAGPVKTFKQVENLFLKTGHPIGRQFRSRIFLGHNPFGRDFNVASKFTGYLICPKPGRYTFCTSSTHASYLLIDDEVVVSNGGYHRAYGDTRAQGAIELSAGLHKLTVYHVSDPKKLIIVAAWQPPGGKRIWPIPAGAFAKVIYTECGPMTSYGQGLAIDFLQTHEGESFIAGRHYQRYNFRALQVGPVGQSIAWNWDFGDGQTARGDEVQHVFLADGLYKVKLAARTSAGLLDRTNRIAVSRCWDQVTMEGLDSVTRQGEIIATYNFDRLNVAGMVHAVEIFALADMPEGILAVGEAFVKRKKARAQAVSVVMSEYTKVLLSRGQVVAAVNALTKAETISANATVRAGMLIKAGRIKLDEMSDHEGAMEFFKLAQERYLPLVGAVGIRDARIGMGDVYFAKGDYKKALAAYQIARNAPGLDNPARVAVRRGSFARYVEDYLRRGLHAAAEEELSKWEHDIPADKLVGYSALLRGQMLAGSQRHKEAAVTLMQAVKVNPASTYSPDLLMLAAECYRAESMHPESRASLQMIVDKYPESSLAEQASKQLSR